MTEPLDRPVWRALTTRQAHLAVASGSAVRINPAFGPFAAAREQSPEGLAALAETLRGPGDRIGLVERGDWPVPPGTRMVGGGEVLQMIADGDFAASTGDERIIRLGDGDAGEMAALAHITEPGPWGSETHRFGAYYGIRLDGRLVAMAGERMKLPGLAELSAVATLPGYRGQGLASVLVRHVLAGFRERGDTPFLHCYAANPGAVRLYTSLGFRVRARLSFTLLALA